MTSDTEILSQMIMVSALVDVEKKYEKWLVKLREPQAPNSIAVIHGLPFDAMVVRVDCFPDARAFFNGSKGECKRADFVIISEEEKRIIYVELKLKKDLWGHVVEQLRGAQCFVKYCQEIGKAYWEEPGFLDGYQSRFVSISHTSKLAKRRTKVDKEFDPHDSPERAMKISSPHYLQYYQLAK